MMIASKWTSLRSSTSAEDSPLNGPTFGRWLIRPESEPIFREAISGETLLGEARRDDLSHAKKGPVFNALGGADDDLAGMKVGAKTGKGGAEKLGRDDREDDLSVCRGGFAAGDRDLGGNGKAGQEKDVFTRLGDFDCGFRAVRPQSDLVRAVAVKREGEGGSPGAGT